MIDFDLVKGLAEGKPKPAGWCLPASFGMCLINSPVALDHNDSTKAMRSFLCAAVNALKLFLAVVAWPACS